MAQEAKRVTVGKVPKEDMQRLKVLQGNMQRFEVRGGISEGLRCWRGVSKERSGEHEGLGWW